jgi:hypothetical protein
MAAMQAVNTHITETYWHVGQHIVEFEQGGKVRADYGKALITSLALFLRLAASQDKAGILQLAEQGRIATQPSDLHAERATTVGCDDEGNASLTPTLIAPSLRSPPLKGKERLPLPFQGGGWVGDGLILAIDAVRKLTTSYGSERAEGECGMMDLVVGRNNQRALRRMFGYLYPVQCASLIAPYRISQKPSDLLSWSHYVELLKLDDELEHAA